MLRESFGPPDPDRKTTVQEGTKGRSSSEAASIAYSWAKIKDARRRVCGVDIAAGEATVEGAGRAGRADADGIGVDGLGMILFRF